MLTLKENKLSAVENFTITKHDYTITLTPDNLDCHYFGLITLGDKTTLTIQFKKVDSCFKARLVLTKETLEVLDNSCLKIISISSNFERESNSIPLYFDRENISLTVKRSASTELSELKRQILSLESKIDALSLGKPVTNIDIQNKECIKPGMTLVAIDNQTFVAAYPFVDIVKEVNGQVAVDGVVNIDSSMVKYNTERTVEDQMKIIGEAIKAQHNSLQIISSELTALSKKIADLTVKIETHLDNGII